MKEAKNPSNLSNFQFEPVFQFKWLHFLGNWRNHERMVLLKKKNIQEALLSIYWEKTRLLKITDIKRYSVDLHCPLPQCYTATWPGAHLSCLSAHHLCLKMQL